MLGLPRLLIVYAIAVPLALILGLLLATPDIMSLLVIGTVLFVLSLPILITQHHLILILFWNTAFNIFFLPGQPHFWLGLTALSFGVSWLNGILGRKRFLRAPELTKAMLFLSVVVGVTALSRHGVGIRTLGGSSYGGRNYVYVAGAIVGYFALTAESVPLKWAGKVSAIYFLSSFTYALSNIVFSLGPAFYFLFYLLPADYVGGQIQASFASADPNAGERLSGLSPAALGIACFFLLQWGVRGLFSLTRPWRMILFGGAVALGSYGGYRSLAVMTVLIFLCAFYFEGLFRTRYVIFLGAFGVFAMGAIMMWSTRLPFQFQRVLSVIPWINIDPSVRADTIATSEWRVDMWQSLLPELPRYLALGKGYAIDPTDLYLASDAATRGLDSSYAAAKIAGDYHNGPLSLLVPFGLGGVIGFFWMIWAGTKVLYMNYRYGLPELRRVNTFLLAFFVARVLFFLFIYGAFNAELFVFTGVLGLSVSLNGGVMRQPARARLQTAPPRPVPAFAAQPA